MTKGDELKKKIKKQGVTIVFLADNLGCSRNRVYAIIGGADCTASEIAGLSRLLHMSNSERDEIFLSENVN